MHFGSIAAVHTVAAIKNDIIVCSNDSVHDFEMTCVIETLGHWS